MTTHYFPRNGKLFYFWKGRVALYAILKALEIGPGDEVILPGFTCVVVPNALIYLGAKPVYADIAPETYNISLDTISPLVTDKTKGIIVQNTFGLSSDLDPIMALAQELNLFVIEDCAHGLGGSYRGKNNGIIADASFFSTQWSKPISTGLGGIAYTENEQISQKLEQIVSRFPKPGFGEQTMLAAQLLVRPLADNPSLYYTLVDSYRFLTQRLGLSVGSSTGNELEKLEIPSGYAKRMGSLQFNRWQNGLEEIFIKVKERQAVAANYDGFLSTKNIAVPNRSDYAEHAMLRYPVRVPNKMLFLERARRNRIPVGDWFVSPLHPAVGDLTPWGYQTGLCPYSEHACREVVNLFTDYPLTQQQLEILFNPK